MQETVLALSGRTELQQSVQLKLLLRYSYIILNGPNTNN